MTHVRRILRSFGSGGPWVARQLRLMAEDAVRHSVLITDHGTAGMEGQAPSATALADDACLRLMDVEAMFRFCTAPNRRKDEEQ